MQARTDRLRRVLKGHMESSNAPRVQALCSLDEIKIKAETCVERLSEAEKLDNLRVQVENSFQGDDLDAISKAVGAFRVSLQVVGDMREGTAYTKKLGEWSDSLENKVVPLLRESIEDQRAGAGAGNTAEAVAGYQQVLETVGRGSCAEKVYHDAVTEHIEGLWRGFDEVNGELGPWISEFFSDIVDLVRADVNWCGEIMPQVLPALRTVVVAVLSELSAKLERRMQTALGMLDAASAVDLLCALHTSALLFVDSFEATLEGVPDGSATDVKTGLTGGGDSGGDGGVLAVLCGCFMALQPRYAALEESQLMDVAACVNPLQSPSDPQ